MVLTLRRRSEFQRVRGGARATCPSFVIEGRARAAAAPADAGRPPQQTGETVPAAPPGPPRFGFTVTRKLGNAVVRNRIRRRLREAVRLSATGLAQDGFDYVLVARPAAAATPFGELRRALEAAIADLHKPRPRPNKR